MKFIEQQKLVHRIKKDFQDTLSSKLNLIEVFAPLFFEEGTGEQDGLAGTEKSVSFRSKSLGKKYEVVHSLAKWKRETLSKHGFPEKTGIVTNMKAIRADEEAVTDIHSMYVDQWDWERVIPKSDRTIATLKSHVIDVYSTVLSVANYYSKIELLDILPENPHFIHSEELLSMYPEKTPKEREDLIAKEYGAVFIIGIGGELKDGKPHDLRASDYDDWITLDNKGRKGLNGDLIVWCPSIDRSLELSSMGIRVDDSVLKRQLKITGEEYKLDKEWHKKLLSGELKQTIGGGIGQSRMIMFIGQFESIHDFKTFKY